MLKRKIVFPMLFILILTSCNFLNPTIISNSNESSDTQESTKESSSSNDESSSSFNSTNDISSQESESTKVESLIDLEMFEALPEIRFASFLGGSETTADSNLKMKVPYDDTYTISLSSTQISQFELYDEKGQLLKESTKTFTITLKKNQIVYAIVKAAKENSKFTFTIKAKENVSVLPYDPIDVEDPTSFETTSNSKFSTLTASPINYVKRDNGLYINCNNPEKLTDEDLNKALTREDVSDKEVFFTFEHNNCITGSFYYGYQVRNTGTTDIYITVKNMGFQLDGAGCWLGEKEWIDFYNTKFTTLNKASWNASQLANFKAYYGFCDTYNAPNNQPITYRVPAGKHIYVMGGTTADSYQNINVFNTANKTVNGGCSNAAVLFSVTGGQAEGAFFAYKDYNKVQSDNTTHQGYIVKKVDGIDYGSQYVGYDNCNGVVDNKATWQFNDATAAQSLPVTYTNYYDENVLRDGTGTPFGAINSTPHSQRNTIWTTHINPQANHNAVGTDMTKYYTLNQAGEEIVIDSDHYDGKGNTANIGNWMIDYIDNFTFVNQGSKERAITIVMNMTGSVAAMVRDANGKIIEGTQQYTIMQAASNYGDAIQDNFSYTVKVAPHSVLQFSVEYNLLANSCGNITHEVILK